MCNLPTFNASISHPVLKQGIYPPYPFNCQIIESMHALQKPKESEWNAPFPAPGSILCDLPHTSELIPIRTGKDQHGECVGWYRIFCLGIDADSMI
jgi:hypothetical protein